MKMKLMTNRIIIVSSAQSLLNTVLTPYYHKHEGRKMKIMWLRLCVAGIAALVLAVNMASAETQTKRKPESISGNATAREPDYKARFIQLCDVAADVVGSDKRLALSYEDSYPVRALAVGYDLTGKDSYLQTCKRWSDKMLKGQQKNGAYPMGYLNKRGYDTADCSSIALGVLATAIRCPNSKDRDRYLRSVESFAKLVLDSHFTKAGAVTCGGVQWWCPTSLFGSLALQLHDVTKKQEYRTAGLACLEWLDQQPLEGMELCYPWEKAATDVDRWQDGSPAIVFYVLEAYSTAVELLEPDDPVRSRALKRIDRVLQQATTKWSGKDWDYLSRWGPKFAGVPAHLYLLGRHDERPESRRQAIQTADRELLNLIALPIEGYTTGSKWKKKKDAPFRDVGLRHVFLCGKVLARGTVRHQTTVGEPAKQIVVFQPCVAVIQPCDSLQHNQKVIF